jgi:hypothetical protein
MKKKVKKINVLGARLPHKVKRTFRSVVQNKGSLISASSDCDGSGGSDDGGACSGGGSDCANCGSCSGN